jgi:hypothetical protein
MSATGTSYALVGALGTTATNYGQVSMTVTLVRLWPDGYQADSVMDFVDWDHGCFSVDNDHPFLVAAGAVAAGRRVPVTVWSTVELEWELNQIDIGLYRTLFYCIPRLAILRHRLVPDNYLVELWLAAEQKALAT